MLREVEDRVRERRAAEGSLKTEPDNVAEPGESACALASEGGNPPHNPSQPVIVRVLCIAGRTELDRAAAEMLAQVLRDQGQHIDVQVLPASSIAQDALYRIDLAGVGTVCVSYLHPQPDVYARYVVRRLKRRAPALDVVVCAWNAPALVAGAKGASTPVSLPANAIVSNIAEAVRAVQVDRPSPLDSRAVQTTPGSKMA